LQPGLFARVFDPPLPEDAARRAANRTMAEAVNAKKERNKAKKERVKLQRGKHRQGSKESDNDEEEDEPDPNIPWGALALEDEWADTGQVNLTAIPQHASVQTEEVVPPRSVGEDVPSRSKEQVCPAPTNPIRGSKRPITDMAESESSDQPLKCSRIMESR